AGLKPLHGCPAVLTAVSQGLTQPCDQRGGPFSEKCPKQEVPAEDDGHFLFSRPAARKRPDHRQHHTRTYKNGLIFPHPLFQPRKSVKMNPACRKQRKADSKCLVISQPAPPTTLSPAR